MSVEERDEVIFRAAGMQFVYALKAWHSQIR